MRPPRRGNRQPPPRRGAWIALPLALAACNRAEREPAPTSAVPHPPAVTETAPSASARPPAVTETAPNASAMAAASAGSGALAPAAPPAAPGETRFAVIGDFGADTPAEASVAALVKSWGPAFVITTGDNNYPAGAAATIDANIGKHYALFIGNYRGRFGPGSKENRFYPSVGNHDWISGLGPYLEYFTLPGNERYYDADLGLVHLYALDSDPHEPDGITADSKQGVWLRERLAASRSCYDVVYFHHPPYSAGSHGGSETMRWPFKKWGADAVLAGHDHTYERLAVDGIPYFVNGLGGASPYEFSHPPDPGSKFRYVDGYGAMRVTATRAAIQFQFFTIDGALRDTISAPPSPGCKG